MLWAAQMALGVVVAPLLIRLYTTEDVMYAAAYGAVLGIAIPLLDLWILGSSPGHAILFSPLPLGAGVAIVLAARKRDLVHALES